MSNLAITYTELKALTPCEESLRRVAKLMGGARKWSSGVNAAQAREAGATFDDLIWVASTLARKDADIDRRLRLWMADCAARVLHIYEKTETSGAPRDAIIAARQYARGEIDEAAIDAARAAAWAAARAARDAARDAAWAASDVAWAADENWQFDRLVMWLSDDEPSDWPIPLARGREAA